MSIMPHDSKVVPAGKRPKSAYEPGISKKPTALADKGTSKSAGRLKTQIGQQDSKNVDAGISISPLQAINSILHSITEAVKSGAQIENTIGENTGLLNADKTIKPFVKKQTPSKQPSNIPNITTSWSKCHLAQNTNMSTKINDRKIQKDKILDRIMTETVEPIPAGLVKKKLKPYTKPHGNFSAKPNETSPHKLVEIYHNKAAKGSDSEEERNKSKIQVKIKPNAIPSLNLNNRDRGDSKELKAYNEDAYEEPYAPRRYFTNKSYELPTIASKMKQAVKIDFSMFNFKAIPFCPVSSTTPSHNIGINIQQVMSIMKTRQPVQGISPTLAHNINLAAEKLNHEPLNSFVSSMSNKIGYGRSNCPLNKYPINYSQLEEMAHTVPEEAVDEIDEVVDSRSGGNTAGPSGDMQSRAHAKPCNWTSNNKKNCTCAPTSNGVDFNHVYNKYRTQPSAFCQKNYLEKHPYTANPIYKRNIICAPSRNIKSTGYVENPNFYMDDTTISPLNGKENSLKEVLMSLHDDFEAMNTKYEVLRQSASADGGAEDGDELKELEAQLNKKEEEINIVMTLYTEVVALKDQVRSLRKFNMTNNELTQYRSPEYNTCPKTTKHIVKLMQQNKQFCRFYRNGFNMM